MSYTDELLNYLKSEGAICFGDFVGKSGQKYQIESDIRNALTNLSSSIKLGKLIYLSVADVIGLSLPFLGVPETGSVLSFFVNLAYYDSVGNDFSFNMLRSSPKEYQLSTQSVYTVLPLDNKQKYILIEDDVVTGKTLLNYLVAAIDNEIQIAAVVSVFGRSSTLEIKTRCNEFGIPYYELINLCELNMEG